MGDPFISRSTGHAQIAFKLVVLAHCWIALIDLTGIRILAGKFNRRYPCSKEICTQAHDHFSLIELVGRDSPFTMGSFISLDQSTVRNCIVLYMAASGIF